MIIKPPFEQRANDAKSFRDMHPGIAYDIDLILYFINVWIIIEYTFFKSTFMVEFILFKRCFVDSVSKASSD